MGMPVTVEIADERAAKDDLGMVFSYFVYVDDTFSTYKKGSEITKINKRRMLRGEWSSDMREIFDLAEQTKQETGGYFDIMTPEGSYDLSGIVKGWAIRNAARMIAGAGFKNFYVDAGGDIQTGRLNPEGKFWSVGIRNPFNTKEIVKTVHLKDEGIATSGTYERGEHIWNPLEKKMVADIVSLSVVGPDIYEADRFATAAFAMGKKGIVFIESRPGLEGYMIDKKGIATMTSGFSQYVS